MLPKIKIKTLAKAPKPFMTATLPPLDKNVNLASHVVLLGAGASIAAYYHWGKKGPKLPSMQDLINVLGIKELIEEAGFDTDGLNFEAFYDDLASSGEHEALRYEIESLVHEYFSEMRLPDEPTIYDYLILSLREKDLIATFNWDPFLLQAYIRNEAVTKSRRPRIAFLHGNVSIGVCNDCKTAGVIGCKCGKCKTLLEPSRLLYPVKHKDYNSDLYINGEWKVLQHKLEKAYMLSVFGYSAPKTDIEARVLLLDKWKNNKMLELSEVEIIDIRPEEELDVTWKEFYFSHHYQNYDDIFKSYLFRHPRRSCDAFASATLMVAPWHDNFFPQFKTLDELHTWVEPLLEEERKYQSEGQSFSGSPLAPNLRA